MIRCRNCGERPASEGHICMVCKRRSDIDPYKALIAMALLVYCGVSLAAYLKPHMPAPPPTAGSSVQPAEELAQRARPVSYTHLDVYKRQAMPSIWKIDRVSVSAQEVSQTFGRITWRSCLLYTSRCV